MSQSLIIKDGAGAYKNLQVDSGSNGYISNHTLVSTVTGSVVKKYYTNGPDGWDWQDTESGSISVANYDMSRKSLIIQNDSEVGKCYVIMGTSSFGTLQSVETAPPYYSFMLDGGATYIADTSTAALGHLIFVPSASNIPDSGSMAVSVTQIY